MGLNKIAKIVKRRKGYYVISERTGRNLGGPYKTLQQAKKRLRQIEFFKRMKKKSEIIKLALHLFGRL